MKEMALFREVHVIKCDDYSWMMLLETCADVATYLMSNKFIPWICIGIKNSGTSTPRVLLVHNVLYEFVSQGFVNYTSSWELHSSSFALPSSNYELHSGNHALYTQATTNYTHKFLWITNRLHIMTHKLPEKVAWETSKTHTTQENAIRVSCIFKFGLQLESI